MTVNYLIWTLIKPSHWILLAAILGIVLWRTRLGGHCRSVTVLLLIAFGLLPTGALLMRPLETRFSKPMDPGEIDGIVVLAGSELARLSELYGELQLNSSGDRLTTFLTLANRYPNARLVHSGGSETNAARAFLLGAGIAPERIRFDELGTNTCESARATHDLVSPSADETWLLVTSAFHLPRSVACFRAIGWEVVPYPADYRRGPNPFYYGLVANLEDLDFAAHEWLGLVYYRARGHTEELFPGPRDAGS